MNKKIWQWMEIIGLITGLVSVIFVNITMNVLWKGNSMVWSEPNQVISTAEVLLSYFGIILMTVIIYKRVNEK